MHTGTQKKTYPTSFGLTLVVSFSVIFPFFAHASTPTLFTVFCTLAELIGIATPVVVALALLGFIWGLAMYLMNLGAGGEDKDKKKGREIMVYGVLTLFVMLSVFGIVNMLQATFQVNNGTVIPPTFQGVPAPVFRNQSC
jgi:hypothetical protein